MDAAATGGGKTEDRSLFSAAPDMSHAGLVARGVPNGASHAGHDGVTTPPQRAPLSPASEYQTPPQARNGTPGHDCSGSVSEEMSRKLQAAVPAERLRDRVTASLPDSLPEEQRRCIMTDIDELLSIRDMFYSVARSPEIGPSNGDEECERLRSLVRHVRALEAVNSEKLGQFEQEVKKLRWDRTSLESRVQTLEQELATARQQASAGVATSGSNCSESRLRAAMNNRAITTAELKQAIGGARALVEEAERELGRAQHRERRDAYEKLLHAMGLEDEAQLQAALEQARRVELPVEDVAKGESKLIELQLMTPEEKAARQARQLEKERKKDAFHYVKTDNKEALEELIDSMDGDASWQDWRDYAGRSLWRFANQLNVATVQAYLAEQLGMEHALPKRTSLEHHKSGGLSRQCSIGSEDGHAGLMNRTSSGAVASVSRQNSSDVPPMTPEGGAKKSPEEAEPAASAQGGSAGAAASTQGYGQERARSVRLLSQPSFEESDGDSGKDVPVSTVTNHIIASPEPLSRRETSGKKLHTMSMRASYSVNGDEPMAEMKASALRAVAQDDVEALEEVLLDVPSDVWASWQNKAGKDLITLAEERGSTEAYSWLAEKLGLLKELERTHFEERDTVWVFEAGEVQPRRATVLEDTPEASDDVLVEFWDGDSDPVRMDRCLVRKMWES
eukprot:TRINITY_DN121015_c0_g1_i1.p1 TRINITY_DN121015_c0_g1~~TRINITY_DN121015_c0_g1_i1.p1  ORF type:complete len:678 (-),score=184.31 TRINITY_DN121015_c0_g1_i1:227-2260(-)